MNQYRRRRPDLPVHPQVDPDRYHQLFEFAPDGLLALADDRITECNRKAAEILGRSRAELIGLRPWDIPPSEQPGGHDSQTIFRAHLRPDASRPAPVQAWTCARPDGTLRCLEVSSGQVSAGSAPTALIGLRDVTDRAQATTHLQTSQDRYRSILDDQTEFIVRWRPDGIRTFVNDSYCRYYGLDRTQAVGSSFFPLISPADLDAVRRRIANLTPDRPVSTGEHRVDRPDGTIGWNRWTDRAFFDDHGRVLEYQSVGQDVTDRALAEDALRGNQSRLSLIYNSSRDYMGLATVVETGEYVMESWNASMLRRCRELGAEIDEGQMVGMTLNAFCGQLMKLSPEKTQFLFQKFDEAKAAPDPIQYEAKTETMGVTIHMETTLTPVRDEQGRCTHVLWVMREITDRKRAEESLRKALSEVEQLTNRLQQENVYLRDEIKVHHQFANIIGTSDALRKVLKEVEQVAATDTSVLILGETGTGKELIAHGIHELGPRKERPLVKVNCAALPASLIESELFGHVRGAFTGAVARRIGRFELADRGTIFLDEIGDLPIEVQVKLLRVLQQGEFERVGSPETFRVSVRVIAATHRDLDRLVREGLFREDLFFRLNVFPIHLPPLRDRREDIPLLARHFIEKYNATLGKQIKMVSSRAMNALQGYAWPGNVRELENIIERAMVISSGSKLELGEWFPQADRRRGASSASSAMREMEKQHILGVLHSTMWRVSGPGGAAEVLDLKPTTLEARMKKLGIRRPRQSGKHDVETERRSGEVGRHSAKGLLIR